MPNPHATVEATGPRVADRRRPDLRVHPGRRPDLLGGHAADPARRVPRPLHEHGDSRIIPLDLSAKLKRPGPLTSPGLCANFVRVQAGESVTTRPNASSELYYVLRGSGRTRFGGQVIPWSRAIS